MTNEEECDRLIAESGVRLGLGKFSPKLTMEEQCKALAIGMKYPDIPRSSVAEHFGIHKTNMGHMWNRYSIRYRPVRRLAEEMGRDAFIAKYLDPEIVEAVLVIRKRIQAASPASPDRPRLPNINRDKYKGIHTMPDGSQVLVDWFTEPRGPGWYGIECDDATNPSGPFDTSKQAYDYMEENLS
jgi:hypothetical protein